MCDEGAALPVFRNSTLLAHCRRAPFFAPVATTRVIFICGTDSQKLLSNLANLHIFYSFTHYKDRLEEYYIFLKLRSCNILTDRIQIIGSSICP